MEDKAENQGTTAKNPENRQKLRGVGAVGSFAVARPLRSEGPFHIGVYKSFGGSDMGGGKMGGRDRFWRSGPVSEATGIGIRTQKHPPPRPRRGPLGVDFGPYAHCRSFTSRTGPPKPASSLHAATTDLDPAEFGRRSRTPSAEAEGFPKDGPTGADFVPKILPRSSDQIRGSRSLHGNAVASSPSDSKFERTCH